MYRLIMVRQKDLSQVYFPVRELKCKITEKKVTDPDKVVEPVFNPVRDLEIEVRDRTHYPIRNLRYVKHEN